MEDIVDIIELLQLNIKRPEKLFRFRNCEEHNFDSLENGYIYLSRPSKMDDDFDVRLNIEITRNEEEYNKYVNEHIGDIVMILLYSMAKAKPEYHKIVSSIDKSLIYEMKNKCFDCSGYIKKDKMKMFLLSKAGHNESTSKAYQVVAEMMSSRSPMMVKFKEQFTQYLLGFSDSIRDKYALCSFCEDIDNDVLWSKYADEFNGFVIEYTIIPNNLTTILPVLYEDKEIIDIFDLFEMGIRYEKKPVNYEDPIVKMVLRQLLTKKPIWSSQKEWRFFSNKLLGKVPFKYASAVYAGKDMSPENLKRLLKICKKKGIKLFKQTMNAMKTKFGYVEVKK